MDTYELDKCIDEITHQFSQFTISDMPLGQINIHNQVQPSNVAKEIRYQLGPSNVGKEMTYYYAVSLPDADRCSFDVLPIYKNKLDALKIIKKYPQARFRKFKWFTDAMQFVWFPYERQAATSNDLSSSEENKVAFKSLTSQQLVQLRKQIEAGNEIKFLDMVWSNPRYLINSVDGPTILQEGTRHNAVHVAAKFQKAKLCLAILNTLSDLKFLALLYPDDDSPNLENKRKHILDLYINMPDKPLSETPLHFASKFGAHETVQILLSYANCERKPNKHNSLPEHIICERSPVRSENLKSKMQSMFEGAYYVAVFRDISNAVEPVLTEPCFADLILKTTAKAPLLKQRLLCSACAGPMGQSDAKCFYLAWKKKDFSKINTFSSAQIKRELKDICLSDPVKGLERIGRQLAKDWPTAWVEYWSPLDAWIDITSENGLALLGHHLKFQGQMKELLEYDHSVCASMTMDEKCDILYGLLEKGLVDNFGEIALEVLKEKKIEDNVFQLFQVLSPYTACLTDYAFSDEEFVNLIHDEIGLMLYLKLNSSVCTYVIESEDLHKLVMLLNTRADPILKSQKLKFFMCIVEFMWYHHIHITQLCGKVKKPVCTCEWIYPSIKYPIFYSASHFYYKLVEMRQNFADEMYTENEVFLSAPNSPAENFDNDFHTPPQSPVSMSLNVSEDRYSNKDRELFINGYEFTESDIDVYRAIENVDVNRDIHPFVFEWKLHVEFELKGVLKQKLNLSSVHSCSPVLSRTPPSSSATIKRRLQEAAERKEAEKRENCTSKNYTKIIPRTLF